MASQKVTLRYLIDVALGSPEPGIVNFNALYTVLQAISEKLDFQDDEIEIDSTYCPISTNALDSKSNVSSEKLVEHQIFDFTSDPAADRIWRDKLKGTPRDKPISEGNGLPGVDMEIQPNEPGKNIAFEKTDDELMKAKKENERLTIYRTELRQHIDALNARLEKIENTFAQSIETEQKVQCIKLITDQFEVQILDIERGVQELKEMKELQEREISACRKKLEHDKLSIAVDGVKRELDELKENIATGGTKEKQQQSLVTCELEPEDKKETTILQDQLIEVKTNVCCLTEQVAKLEQDVANNKRGSSAINLSTFENDVENLKKFLEYSEAELSALKDDHTSQRILIEDLTTKLEELMKNKIDKDEIDELLSEKADYTMLQRKVSVENINADRRKMDQQLSEISQCFVLNNEHVQKQISDIKKFLGDQSLEDLLYDFRVKIDKDIQVVRNGIKMLLEMKPDVDAAAARLKSQQCLSCDQDVSMKAIENSNLSKFGDAYVSKSISPNVTFEIGKLRQAGKIGQPLDLDDCLTDMAKNFRHSGGMHTIVTNKDRVEKMKHNRHK